MGTTRGELPVAPSIGQEQELKDEAQTKLESVSITVIQDALAVIKVSLPFQTKMGGIIDIPVQRRAG